MWPHGPQRRVCEGRREPRRGARQARIQADCGAIAEQSGGLVHGRDIATDIAGSGRPTDDLQLPTDSLPDRFGGADLDPAQLPALRNISGWLQIPGNTVLSCNYRWTANATESGFTIGVGGVSYPVGNGTMRDGATIDFQMYRPSREDADGGCTP